MRFLLDKNVSYRVGPYLTDATLRAIHVDDVDRSAAPDVEILEFARAEGWIIVSSDTDCGTLLAAQRATSPSVILTREISTLPAKQLADLLIANLPAIEMTSSPERWWRSASAPSGSGGCRCVDSEPPFAGHDPIRRLPAWTRLRHDHRTRHSPMRRPGCRQSSSAATGWTN